MKLSKALPIAVLGLVLLAGSACSAQDISSGVDKVDGITGSGSVSPDSCAGAATQPLLNEKKKAIAPLPDDPQAPLTLDELSKSLNTCLYLGKTGAVPANLIVEGSYYMYVTPKYEFTIAVSPSTNQTQVAAVWELLSPQRQDTRPVDTNDSVWMNTSGSKVFVKGPKDVVRMDMPLAEKTGTLPEQELIKATAIAIAGKLK